MSFIEKSLKIHGLTYSYDSVEYKNRLTKVKIYCNKCNTYFYQSPVKHLLGRGCSNCCSSSKLTNDEFIRRSNIKHNLKYDYSKSKYLTFSDKVEIICPIHGVFFQKAGDHLIGKGCNKCSIESSRMTQNEFITKCKTIHNNFYQYDKTVYINSSNAIIITCPIHGDFIQNAKSHSSGYRCRLCARTSSKIETELYNELLLYFPDLVHNDKTVLNRKELDISLHKTKRAIEFNGDFWHFNPKKYDENYKCRIDVKKVWAKDLEKIKEVKSKGWKIFILWESDYKSNKNFYIDFCRKFLNCEIDNV
jgi:G:T-mismatch repair DNA endonuclease (very short patch repair protein)